MAKLRKGFGICCQLMQGHLLRHLNALGGSCRATRQLKAQQRIGPGSALDRRQWNLAGRSTWEIQGSL